MWGECSLRYLNNTALLNLELSPRTLQDKILKVDMSRVAIRGIHYDIEETRGNANSV